jgi:hypothetical protein
VLVNKITLHYTVVTELPAYLILQKTGNLNKNVARPCYHCCCGKVISIADFECASIALFIQHAVRMRLMILSSVAFPAIGYHIFPHCLINGQQIAQVVLFLFLFMFFSFKTV